MVGQMITGLGLAFAGWGRGGFQSGINQSIDSAKSRELSRPRNSFAQANKRAKSLRFKDLAMISEAGLHLVNSRRQL